MVQNLDAYTMQQKAQFTDLILQTEDGGVFNVHRWALAGLASLLIPPQDTSSGAATATPAVIHVGILSRVMQEVIHLAYTGTCRLTEELFVPLLLAADNFNIRPLLKLCGDHLLSLPQPTGADLVRNLRLAARHLCSHVVERLTVQLRRRFPEEMGPGGAALLLTPPELKQIIACSDLPLQETDLLSFLLAAAEWRHWSSKETAGLLEHVRFTLLSPEQLVQLSNDPRMAPFLAGSAEVDSLVRVLHVNELLPSSHVRHRLRPAVLAFEEPRIPRQVVLVMGGWAAAPPGPTDQVEVFNYITSSWRTHKLKLPVKRAYHGLILRGSQVGEFMFLLYRYFTCFTIPLYVFQWWYCVTLNVSVSGRGFILIKFPYFP